ncbi:hypothetical protein M501DRAFT_1006262 [Patellaria atrata CBS 101060]|uniref:Uncharacterized protein n=1 Tax=Patellaria atrata CBS 101060 TaxID=1346257 RepID=A0A9P4VVQ9_9PEZI|nr:hypothetical protein M501DRAFT_1006262 [Patellaria atrata CBS 101060]
MQPSTIRNVQIASSAIIIAFSLAIIGTAGHSLDIYNKQRFTNPWWMPLWPSHFETRGTNTIIGSGAALFFLNLIHIVVTFIPKLNLLNHPTHRALLTFAICLPACLISLSTVVYAHILNGNSPNLDTIQTWTCRFKNAKQADEFNISASESNNTFATLCSESKFALYGTLIVFLIQGLMLFVAIVGWVVEKWAQRKNNKEWKDTGSVEMNGVGDKGPHVNVQNV